MLSTKISMLSGTDPDTIKISVGDKLNVYALNLLSSIDAEYKEVYDYIITLIDKYKEDSLLLTVGYIFVYDMQIRKTAPEITKDIKDMLASKKSYSVSDAVKNSAISKWWDALVVKQNREVTYEDVAFLTSLYNNAIHYLYVACLDKNLSKKAREKKEAMMKALEDKTNISYLMFPIVIEYSVQQHLGCTVEQAIKVIRKDKISAVSAVGKLETDNVKDIVDSAVNLSTEIRKWFDSDTDQPSNVVYVDKDSLSPSSNDFDTSLYLVAGAVALAGLLFLTKNKKK